ncbi:HNH endonuclease [Vibrio rotiferianus]|uniref:HNH endonuclease n=1 Tax=Vibrio rotiferianus TaxID=190895 RepID=UPI0009E2EC9D
MLSSFVVSVPSTIIAKFRQTDRFTWHEIEGMKTLQLVPTDINGKFWHLGGISEALKI